MKRLALLTGFLAVFVSVPYLIAADTPTNDLTLSEANSWLVILKQDFCERQPTHWKCATPSPMPTPTAVPTPTPTLPPSPTPTPTASPTPTPEPTLSPTPTLVPTPTPTPTAAGCPSNLQTALNGGGTLVLTGCTYAGGGWTIDSPVYIIGGRFYASASTRVFVVRANNVVFSGVDVGPGLDGIWAESPSNLTIQNSHIHDTVYSGIMYLSAEGGLIENNLIERVGANQPNGTNAYGIAISNYTGSIYSDGVIVRSNTVTDVPTWHCYDTHAGHNILFESNAGFRCSRAFFITTDSANVQPVNVTVRNNLAGNPSPVTYNLTGITLYNTVSTTVTGNAISSGYYFGTTGNYHNGVYDYAGLSTNLVASGNYVGESLP